MCYVLSYKIIFIVFLKNKKTGRITWESVAVVDLGLPVAGLATNVEGETGWASDRRQPDGARRPGPVTPEDKAVIVN